MAWATNSLLKRNLGGQGLSQLIIWAELGPTGVGIGIVPQPHTSAGYCVRPRRSYSPLGLPGEGICIIPCLQNAHLVLELDTPG